MRADDEVALPVRSQSPEQIQIYLILDIFVVELLTSVIETIPVFFNFLSEDEWLSRWFLAQDGVPCISSIGWKAALLVKKNKVFITLLSEDAEIVSFVYVEYQFSVCHVMLVNIH